MPCPSKMIDLHLSAFAPRWRFLYAVRIDAYGTAAKNVGVEETDPRRPHFVVTGENTGTGVGN